ncbi:MAG: ferredoxin--NADP reductase [Myxococcota bacterium]|jgi:3-ketosteroid 9alpha-monooxygenase subunit B|nr:3-ketosteroid-9-alpha-hydroxylase [Deltaproteobacteria bacterium]MCP4238955.1 ferredoxin--NADP reductase [bacterium]MDP6074111.1 ferredoxin--NADP reductase [Myxococcota bacterium]MDP6243152.1 ferredoxin--NADP reductase [Myxococcota bacterium]MDP7074052.1 ferredoxin--NADP reductase [Myxococcota bacterium]
MLDPTKAGVSEQDWREATSSCEQLRVTEVVRETHDTCSLVFAVPDGREERFRYRAGQFLSFKVPHEGKVLTRSYSLSSSPECDSRLKVTVKRIEDGRISNWINDTVEPGEDLIVVPPAGLFVLNEKTRPIIFFAGGSGITPCMSLLKTALLTTDRRLRLVYANRDEHSIIFENELEMWARRHSGRLSIHHSLDDRDGFLDVKRIEHHAVDCLEGDFYLCGPGVFMDLVERALAALHVPSDQIHIERFVSPPDPDLKRTSEAVEMGEVSAVAPESITVILDGQEHEVEYEAEERVLGAAHRAGLKPPFSCGEGYCSCCMAKLSQGKVRMVVNDCLTPDLLEEGWILTCQSVCVSRNVRVEYPD